MKRCYHTSYGVSEYKGCVSNTLIHCVEAMLESDKQIGMPVYQKLMALPQTETHNSDIKVNIGQSNLPLMKTAVTILTMLD